MFLDATGTISGNTVEDHEYTGADAATGVLLFSGPAGTVVKGNFLNDNEVGVHTNISATIGGPTIADGNTITGSSLAGIVAAGGSVKIQNNSVTLGAIGLSVDGSTVMAEGNTLNGNTIGALIQDGGIADLGQTGKTTTSDFTGLGISVGNNDFSGYVATATASAGAIVNLNTNGANANPGRQGTPFDVTAFGNLWAVNTPMRH